MSLPVLPLAIAASELLLALAMACAVWRIIRGPRAQDRALALDSFYTTAMLLLLAYGVETGRTLYFEVALGIGLLGFAGTAALAKFLMRGEVIE